MRETEREIYRWIKRERERDSHQFGKKTDKNPGKTNTKWDFKSESFVYFLFGFFLDA